jgi:anti-anti-sigma factor
MRAHQEAAPLVVVRSEAESGRVGLRLIGELDLNTVELFEAELARTRASSPPSAIDLSELRFLDLVGLRALLRGVESDGAGTTRLVGATGIVRRLIDLAHTLDDEAGEPARAPFPAETRTRVGARQDQHASSNGVGGGAAVASNPPNGKPR